ncbi:MAG: MFS transporter [Prochlorotrichaceae cyanobacterium]
MITALETLSPNCRRSLKRLFGAGLLFWGSLSMLLPTLPLYISDRGGDLQQVGLVVGSFAIGLLCFRPWLGQSADRQGRKPVLLAALGVAATAPVGYLLMGNLALLIGWRTYHGLSVAGFTIAYLTWVVDLVPPAQRGEIIGYMTLVNPIGLSVGPALGGFLLEAFGYPPLFLTASLLGSLSLFLASTAQERPEAIVNFPSLENAPANTEFADPPLTSPPFGKTSSLPAHSLGYWLQSFVLPLGWRVVVIMFAMGAIPILVHGLGLSSYLIWFFLPFYGLAAFLGLHLHPGSQVWRPGIWVIPLCLLLLGLSFGTVTTFIALFLKTTGLALNPGWFYTTAALASFSVRLIVGRYSDRYGRGIFLTASFLLYTLAMLQLANATTIVAFLGGAAFEGAGFGILISIIAALVADRSPAQERGQIFSICLAGLDVGIAIAGPLLGSWADYQGYRATFQVATLLSGLALLVFLLYGNKTLLSSLRFGLGLSPDDYAQN